MPVVHLACPLFILSSQWHCCRLITTFCSLGFFACYDPMVLLPYVSTVCLVATVVESLPINEVRAHVAWAAAHWVLIL